MPPDAPLRDLRDDRAVLVREFGPHNRHIGAFIMDEPLQVINLPVVKRILEVDHRSLREKLRLGRTVRSRIPAKRHMQSPDWHSRRGKEPLQELSV